MSKKIIMSDDEIRSKKIAILEKFLNFKGILSKVGNYQLIDKAIGHVESGDDARLHSALRILGQTESSENITQLTLAIPELQKIHN
jgi:hypothetical protein